MTESNITGTHACVRVSVQGPVGWLVFDNPGRHNAMSLAMWAQTAEALQRLAEDKAVRVIVMRGCGDEAFVSGADVSEFDSSRQSAAAARRYAEVAGHGRAALSNLGKPLIAMIRGYCFGAGVDVAMRADVRIAGDDAEFCIPAARLGMGYALDSARLLVRLVGPGTAKDLLLSARRLRADEALRCGLVQRVVPAAALQSVAADYARTLAELAPLSQLASKRTVDALGQPCEVQDVESLEASVWACFESEDYREGRRAFQEGRPPRFVGR